MNADVLNSWKEVASYLGRGVRTVQRWEQELSLPVRRPRGKSRSAIIALRSELDEWLQRASLHQLPLEEPGLPPPTNGRHRQLHERTILLVGQTRLLVDRSNQLCVRLQDMRDRVNRTVQLTAAQIERNTKHNRLEFVKSSPPGPSELITDGQPVPLRNPD